MTTLAGIAAEAYRMGLHDRGYFVSELSEVDDDTRKDILAATQESLDAVFKELGVWTHPDFPGWIGLRETGQEYFFIRNSGVMNGMTMSRQMDDPSEDADYDEGFSAAYRAAHKQRCPALIRVDGCKRWQCERTEGHLNPPHFFTSEGEYISW